MQPLSPIFATGAPWARSQGSDGVLMNPSRILNYAAGGFVR